LNQLDKNRRADIDKAGGKDWSPWESLEEEWTERITLLRTLAILTISFAVLSP